MFSRTVLILTSLLISVTCFCQQNPASPSDPASSSASAPAAPSAPNSQAPSDQTQTSQTQSDKAKTPEEIERELEKKEQSQHVFLVIPAFSATDRHHPPPLTPRGKFDLMGKTYTDPYIYALTAVQAGIGQATDSFQGYGQGVQGYAKRYAANLTDAASSNFFCNFVYPVMFKQDPRYFRLGEGSFGKRFFSAISQVFVAHQDSGREMFAFDNVLGAFTSGTISNLYYPKSDRGAALTASRASVSFLYGGLGNFLVEFWPDIDHHFRKNHHASGAPATAAPAPVEAPTQDPPR